MASSRRLAAIMFTDMVGYTARTQSDERGTLALLQEEEALVRPLLERHRGRTVKSTGDGFLVEFPSALQATECAVEIQERLRERNQGSGNPTIELRIGIHLGDIEERGSDIFGDAVNIASRVQPTADPGGVAVSQQVFDQVRNKIALPLEKLEPKALKGLQFPMDVFRVVLPWNVPSGSPGTPAEGNRLAVLPFANISPDPQDAYFSDGLTEEVITVLSEIGELRVIARTSVDAYKGHPKPIPQVGAELGVNWVLEGSVRKAGNRLRITAQLIDVKTQAHAWANTYDRELDDVFAVQTEMAKRVADALKIKLLAREVARIERRAPPDPESYLEYLRGRAGLHGVAESGLREAIRHFERAIAIDERNAVAHAGLADAHAILGSLHRHLPKSEWREVNRRHALRALELDPELAEARTSLALGLLVDDRLLEAEAELRRAIALNPSYAGAHDWYAEVLADLGRSEESLREFGLAAELDPLSSLILAEEISLLLLLNRLEEAEVLIEKLGRIEGDGILYADRKADIAYARGDFPGARKWDERLAELLPGRPELIGAAARLAAAEGDIPGARELLKEAEALPETEQPLTLIAWTYARMGEIDACFLWLERSIATGRFSPRLVRYALDFAEVRKDPRYPRLLSRLRSR